jgi:hypothetical protein
LPLTIYSITKIAIKIPKFRGKSRGLDLRVRLDFLHNLFTPTQPSPIRRGRRESLNGGRTSVPPYKLISRLNWVPAPGLKPTGRSFARLTDLGGAFGLLLKVLKIVNNPFLPGMNFKPLGYVPSLLPLIVFKPVIDDLKLLPQHRQHHHFGEGLTKGIAGVLFAVEINDFPIQPRKPIEQRFLDVITFVDS